MSSAGTGPARDPSPPGDVTVLLRQWAAGDGESREKVIAALYPELRKIARSRMRSERQDHTLQATALVSEFFVDLARNENIAWNNRAHFLASASQIMRRLLVDYSRWHNAGKRGNGCLKVTLEGLAFPGYPGGLDMIDLDRHLTLLARDDDRMARVVEMRCFGGFTHREIGETLGVDERTVTRDWQVARAWLAGRLAPKHGS